MTRTLFLVFVLASACTAQAQVLSDPTRPPGVSADGGEAGDAPKLAVPQLQSILISPQRKLAVIDGQTLAPGDRFGGATLVSISVGSVVLRRGAELQTLQLLPGIDKKVSAASRGRSKEEKP